jgi:hypothetical protein
VIVAGLSLSGVASAGVIQADFSELLNLPDFRTGSPRIEANNGVALPSAGPQLTGANVISNPDNWANSLVVSFDAATGILSLTGDTDPDGNTYQIITVSLSNILFNNGSVITGITPISTGNAVFASPNSAGFTLATSFTGNSFSVSYTDNAIGTSDVFNIQAATDTFQITTGASAATPEPGTIGMMLAGFVMAVSALRRR